MILKSIQTESAMVTKSKLNKGDCTSALKSIDSYVTDPDKTSSGLIGCINCSPGNWARMSVSCRALYGKEGNKLFRHIILALSQRDNDIMDKKFASFIRRVCAYFNDMYYIKYAIHKNTTHKHAHILVCNTSLVDGKQLSFGEAELSEFKDYTNSIAEGFGLEGIAKIDSSIADPLEIDENLFEETPSLEDYIVSKPDCQARKYIPINPREVIISADDEEPKIVNHGRTVLPSTPNGTNIINIILPPDTKTTLFYNERNQPVLTCKPRDDYFSACRYTYEDVRRCNTALGLNAPVEEEKEPVSYSGMPNFSDFFRKNDILISEKNFTATIINKK